MGDGSGRYLSNEASNSSNVQDLFYLRRCGAVLEGAFQSTGVNSIDALFEQDLLPTGCDVAQWLFALHKEGHIPRLVWYWATTQVKEKEGLGEDDIEWYVHVKLLELGRMSPDALHSEALKLYVPKDGKILKLPAQKKL